MPMGTDFLYSDVNTPTLAASKSNLDNLNNAVSRTLAPIYKSSLSTNETKSGDVNYMMYNDEVPDGKVSTNRGHTKGVVMFDAKSLVWLVHSTPNFLIKETVVTPSLPVATSLVSPSCVSVCQYQSCIK